MTTASTSLETARDYRGELIGAINDMGMSSSSAATNGFLEFSKGGKMRFRPAAFRALRTGRSEEKWPADALRRSHEIASVSVAASDHDRVGCHRFAFWARIKGRADFFFVCSPETGAMDFVVRGMETRFSCEFDTFLAAFPKMFEFA